MGPATAASSSRSRTLPPDPSGQRARAPGSAPGLGWAAARSSSPVDENDRLDPEPVDPETPTLRGCVGPADRHVSVLARQEFEGSVVRLRPAADLDRSIVVDHEA